jgi:hypothetical protein
MKILISDRSAIIDDFKLKIYQLQQVFTVPLDIKSNVMSLTTSTIASIRINIENSLDEIKFSIADKIRKNAT